MKLLTRALRHLTMTRWHLRRHFPEAALQAITRAVKTGEQRHGGEIRVAIEVDLPLRNVLARQLPRQRAAEVFAQLGVWDTDARNGVLVYLCLADRAIEIVADRGYRELVTAESWTKVCHNMQAQLRAGQSAAALSDAVLAISDLIAPHFPCVDRNELPDRPALL